MYNQRSDDLKNQLAKLIAEVDQLQAKQKENAGLTADEEKHLEELANQIESLETELKGAVTSERISAVKSRMQEPTRSAPQVNSKIWAEPKSTPSVSEALGSFLRNDRDPQSFYKLRSINLDIDDNGMKLPVNYGSLNFKQRTTLSKGGSLTGADLVWQSYSSKVVEYLTYTSPLLGLLNSETTADGNLRTYFKIDDTSMESTLTTAGGGSEITPTIPSTNLATAKVIIGCFNFTSGAQTITYDELQDAYINLEEKVAKANANSHARAMERHIVSATGNGQTGIGGIEDACTAQPTADNWSAAALESLYFSVPAQYRKDCIFLTNGDTYGDIYSALKDETGKSLFERTVEDGIEYDILLGKKLVQSNFVSADTVLFFNPSFYMLRLVQGQLFQKFNDSSTFPHTVWKGLMRAGGAWLGPDEAAVSLDVDAVSGS